MFQIKCADCGCLPEECKNSPSAKNAQLEEKFNGLLQYLRTNSIEVPSF